MAPDGTMTGFERIAQAVEQNASVDPSLRLEVEATDQLDFVAVNASPERVRVLVSWQGAGTTVNRWHFLNPGELWQATFDLPGATTDASAHGVLMTTSSPAEHGTASHFENDTVHLLTVHAAG